MGVHRQENGGSGREAKVEHVPVVLKKIELGVTVIQTEQKNVVERTNYCSGSRIPSKGTTLENGSRGS